MSFHTSLTGGLPVSFGKLTNLIELRLGSNMFSGEVSSFSDLGNLILLDLSGKVKFIGETVFHYFSMKSFYCSHILSLVSENDLRGSIPNDFLSSISGRKPMLVDLSSNSLSGIVPHHLDR